MAALICDLSKKNGLTKFEFFNKCIFKKENDPTEYHERCEFKIPLPDLEKAKSCPELNEITDNWINECCIEQGYTSDHSNLIVERWMPLR